jgi:hypothetical protein
MASRSEKKNRGISMRSPPIMIVTVIILSILYWLILAVVYHMYISGDGKADPIFGANHNPGND